MGNDVLLLVYLGFRFLPFLYIDLASIDRRQESLCLQDIPLGHYLKLVLHIAVANRVLDKDKAELSRTSTEKVKKEETHQLLAAEFREDIGLLPLPPHATSDQHGEEVKE